MRITVVAKFNSKPMKVMRFGANQSGSLVTNHLQYTCRGGSIIDEPDALYLCSLSRASCSSVKTSDNMAAEPDTLTLHYRLQQGKTAETSRRRSNGR